MCHCGDGSMLARLFGRLLMFNLIDVLLQAMKGQRNMRKKVNVNIIRFQLQRFQSV